MFVSDLNDFLDLPDDVPGPARRMAHHLGSVVRAATAGEPGVAWVSALPCQRRPGRRRCPGRIAVYRADRPAPIEWRCTSCGDEGVISGWEASHFDLRRPGSSRVEEDNVELLLGEEVAETLRGIQVFDVDCERVVFAARANNDRVVMSATEEEIEALAGFLAAEADNEADRRRRKRLDAAFSVLDGALVKGASSPTKALSAVPAAPAAHPGAKGQVRALPRRDVSGRCRIVEMDLWDREGFNLVGPAFIEFGTDRTGRFRFVAVRLGGTGEPGPSMGDRV